MQLLKSFIIMGVISIVYGHAAIQSVQETQEIARNIALVNKLWDNGDDYFIAHSNEFLADTVRVHLAGLNSDGLDLDLAELTKQEAERVAVLPGKWEVVNGYAFDDKIVAYCKCTGIHAGEFEGLSATNKPFTFYGMILFRFSEGKICETWSSWDKMSVYKQLL